MRCPGAAPQPDAGIRQGDIITQIDGRDITSLEIVTEILSEHEVGDTVEVTLIRNRNTHEPVKVTLTLQSQQESTDETGDFWGRSEREDSDGNRSPFTIDNLELLRRRRLGQPFFYVKALR